MSFPLGSSVIFPLGNQSLATSFIGAASSGDTLPFIGITNERQLHALPRVSKDLTLVLFDLVHSNVRN